MAEAKKLISLRVSERDWTDFMAWADSNGSNASAEINRYIRATLGRIDSNANSVNTTNQIISDGNLVTKDDLKNALSELSIPIDSLINKDQLGSVIADLRKEFSWIDETIKQLQTENEQLKKDGPTE